MSFPKKGNSFPGGARRDRPPREAGASASAEFADSIAAALRRELGSAPSAVKTAAGWTDSNERTVKNWFAGRSGPSGHHLVALARHSDEVLYTLLQLADRRELLTAKRLTEARDKLWQLLKAVDALLEQPS